MRTDTRANLREYLLSYCFSVLCRNCAVMFLKYGIRFAKYQVNLEAETRRGSETDKEQIKYRRLQL